MKTARQLDADRAQTVLRLARLLGATYHATLAAIALTLTLCAAAQLAVL